MYKLFSPYLIALFVGISMLCLPGQALAAELYFTIVPNTVPGDTATIVDVHIDPQGKSVNVVDGTINLQPTTTASIAADIITDGSVLTLWPTPPQFNPTTHDIEFTGGLPGGFSEDSELFRIRVTAPTSVTAHLALANGTAYLNDGKGTAETIAAQPMILTTQLVSSPVAQTTQSTISHNQTHSRWIVYGIILLVLLAGIASAFVYKKHEK
jgi:hypothetical protein